MSDFNIMKDKLSNAQIAWRAAQDIDDGSYVNLGIGFPEMIAKFQPEGRDVTYYTDNGVLGFGKAPAEGEEDWDLINAGKKAITLNPGASFFHHADSFAMVRGGHLDLAVLGAYQVAQNGDLANWRVGSKGVPAVGGAMDLVHGAKRVAVVTDHITKKGEPKLVEQCTFPLTGVGCVTRVYTSLAVLDISEGKFILREKLPAISMDELQAVTGATLHIDGDVADLIVPENLKSLMYLYVTMSAPPSAVMAAPCHLCDPMISAQFLSRLWPNVTRQWICQPSTT